IINSNFPGRLGALARYLTASGHEVLFVARYGRREASLPGVQRLVLKIRDVAVGEERGMVQLWKRTLHVGEQALAPMRLLAREFRPDMVLSTHAEGIAFFAHALLPEAFHVFYPGDDVPYAEAGAMRDMRSLRVLQGDCCIAFTRADVRSLPDVLQSWIHLATPWVETELLDPAQAKVFLPDGRTAAPELISVDMKGLDETATRAVRRLMVDLLTLRPRCHAVLEYGENHAGTLWLRRLPEDVRSRLHAAEFLPLAARRDLFCTSSLHLCQNERDGLFPGRLEAMSCGALLMSPLSGEKFLKPGINMLPFPQDSHRKRLAAVLHALEHAPDYAPLRTRARQDVLAVYAPELVLPAHTAMLMDAYAEHRRHDSPQREDA
ncbi:hypothetical protein, partial [uncultured Mailhella sp.]|uniref:hypothetical protein n=1 Tax=uncultured Mailhella sp. TaxID=1981031 RepID=UPI00261317A7